MNKDYYKILDLNKDASVEEIKKSYRRLSMKYHPDKNNGDEDSTNRFKEINEAYSVLSDPDKRRQYDNPSPHMGRAFNPFDFFSMRNRRPNPNAPKKGMDLKFVIEVSIGQFIFGGKHTINVSYEDPCQSCNGKGFSEFAHCGHCNGQGQVSETKQGQGAFIMSTKPCPVCNGQGQVGIEECNECNGKGKTSVENRDIEVEIPAGTRDEQGVRIGQAGGKGVNGGPNGDVLVKFRMKYPDLSNLSDEQKELLRSI